MLHEYLSEERIADYGHFPAELSAADLERCFGSPRSGPQ
jgi:hypothetical protein